MASVSVKTVAQSQLAEALTMLFDSGEDSDFTVKCSNRVWQLHRIVLRAGSEYFKRACNERFEEGLRNSIELKEHDAHMVGLMLRYLYAHDYRIDDFGEPPLIAHARMYAMADKYDVGLLKELAVQKFAAAFTPVNPQSLDIAGFVAAIEIIYTTTLGSDRGLRDCLFPVLMQCKQQLRDNEGFMGLIKSALGDGDFTVDVIDAWSGVDAANRTWRCTSTNCKQKGQGLPATCSDCGQPSLAYSSTRS